MQEVLRSPAWGGWAEACSLGSPGGGRGGPLEHISSGHTATPASALGLRVLGDGLLLAESAGEKAGRTPTIPP